ncbi:hypothetical protein ANN_22757 [Periplaneta americana]|uniref:Uncharacterized protein n=1 Tax=Periplaneta americana TaxID=6978 RepID=A0ABQ8SK12_PERAM|nr:hypothetical protein ANN_22757 [Periplaneta americana]
MSPGSNTESYPTYARIGLRENPGKNLNQVTCLDRVSNPGHLVSQPDALTVTPQVTTLPDGSPVDGPKRWMSSSKNDFLRELLASCLRYSPSLHSFLLDRYSGHMGEAEIPIL